MPPTAMRPRIDHHAIGSGRSAPLVVMSAIGSTTAAATHSIEAWYSSAPCVARARLVPIT